MAGVTRGEEGAWSPCRQVLAQGRHSRPGQRQVAADGGCPEAEEPRTAQDTQTRLLGAWSVSSQNLGFVM